MLDASTVTLFKLYLICEKEKREITVTSFMDEAQVKGKRIPPTQSQRFKNHQHTNRKLFSLKKYFFKNFLAAKLFTLNKRKYLNFKSI